MPSHINRNNDIKTKQLSIRTSVIKTTSKISSLENPFTLWPPHWDKELAREEQELQGQPDKGSGSESQLTKRIIGGKVVNFSNTFFLKCG